MNLRLEGLWRRPERGVPERALRATPTLNGRSQRLGLALSAGGAKGLAHVGVLQVLEENHIELDAIAGSSMGAYVGALWACGFSGAQLEALAAQMHDKRALRRLADPLFLPLQGIIQGKKAKQHLMRSIGDTRFEQLERTLLISSFDLDTKERLVLRKGVIADAVHASCAMPGIVAPVWIDGHRCADGGVVDPLPVGALKKFAQVDIILAVNVQPSIEQIDEHLCAEHSRERAELNFWQRAKRCLNRSVNLAAPGNIIDTMRQSIKAAQLRLAEESARHADLCLRPNLHSTSPWHDYSNYRHYIEAGREIATASLPAIRTLLSSATLRHENH